MARCIRRGKTLIKGDVETRVIITWILQQDAVMIGIMRLSNPRNWTRGTDRGFISSSVVLERHTGSPHVQMRQRLVARVGPLKREAPSASCDIGWQEGLDVPHADLAVAPIMDDIQAAVAIVFSLAPPDHGNISAPPAFRHQQRGRLSVPKGWSGGFPGRSIRKRPDDPTRGLDPAMKTLLVALYSIPGSLAIGGVEPATSHAEIRPDNMTTSSLSPSL
jgi:hypothetical protein